jgi:hypothetical protein
MQWQADDRLERLRRSLRRPNQQPVASTQPEQDPERLPRGIGQEVEMLIVKLLKVPRLLVVAALLCGLWGPAPAVRAAVNWNGPHKLLRAWPAERALPRAE